MRKQSKQPTKATIARAKLFNRLRKSHGISIKRLAVDTDTTRDTVRAMEHPGHDPRESTLETFFKFYATRDKQVKHLCELQVNSLTRVGAGNGGLRGERGRG